MNIKFRSTKDVLEFVNFANQMNGDVIVYCGHIEIDAKSTMGMMCIPVNKELRVKINSTNDAEENNFYKEVERYRI